MHRSPVLFRTTLLGLCVLLPTAAFAGAKPSFDCAKARSATEKAICKDAGLAASDAAIAAAYKRLESVLDPGAAAALAGDQRWFVDVRDGLAEGKEGASPSTIGGALKERVKFLNALNPQPADSFIGSWHNVAGGIDITKAADGSLKIAGDTAQPVDGRWVCSFKGSGKISGDVLDVKQDPEEGESDQKSSGLKLTRVGASLKVEFVPVPGSDDLTADYCGLNGSLDGDYFSVPVSYSD